MMGLRRTMYGLRDGVTSTYSDIDASINTESNESFYSPQNQPKGIQTSGIIRVQSRAQSDILMFVSDH